MKRLGRWLFNFAAAGSLILCVAVIALSVRSDWVWDDIGHSGGNRYWRLGSCWGQLYYIEGNTPQSIQQDWWRRSEPSTEAAHSRSGFIREAWSPAFTFIGIPHWFLATLTGAPMALWAAHFLYHRHWKRQRVRKGVCIACGYDLRATPQRCPECGTVSVAN